MIVLTISFWAMGANWSFSLLGVLGTMVGVVVMGSSDGTMKDLFGLMRSSPQTGRDFLLIFEVRTGTGWISIVGTGGSGGDSKGHVRKDVKIMRLLCTLLKSVKDEVVSWVKNFVDP